MAVEIELKAHVNDPFECTAALDKNADFQAEFIKDDTYWKTTNVNTLNMQIPEVRIRKEWTKNENGEKSFVLVTYKTKNVINGIEVNNENEFALCEAENGDTEDAVKSFEELLRRFGLAPSISKNKKGRAWNYNGITAELSLVKGLGYFVELEIISASSYSDTVARCRERLLGLLDTLNISRDSIEDRYYTEMLFNGALKKT